MQTNSKIPSSPDFKLFDTFTTKVFMKFISKLFYDSNIDFHEAKDFFFTDFILERKSSLTYKKRKNKTINFLSILLVSNMIWHKMQRDQFDSLICFARLIMNFDGCNLTEEVINVCCLCSTFISRHSNMNRNEYYQTLVLFFLNENDFLIKRMHTLTHIRKHTYISVHSCNTRPALEK